MLAEEICNAGLTKWEFGTMPWHGFDTLLAMLDSQASTLGATHHARFGADIDIKLETLKLPSELSKDFTDGVVDRLISVLNQLKHLTQVQVEDSPLARLNFKQIRGLPSDEEAAQGQVGSRTLYKPGKAAGQVEYQLSPASSALVCGLAIGNPGLTDINLVGNHLRAMGARAAARLVKSHSGLRHLRLDECELGCQGLIS